jgi:hypothetical protein
VWAKRFTDAMLERKRAGASFDRAWELTVAEYGVATRELGGGFVDESDLFGAARGARAQELAREWWRSVCRAAWENAPARGGGPSRLYLLPGLTEFVSAPDESRPARRPARAA